jgi:hypothetical protein
MSALIRHFPDESRRGSAYASIKWYLARRGDELSVPSAAFRHVQLFIYPFGGLRILWERRGDGFVVWSVYAARVSAP